MKIYTILVLCATYAKNMAQNAAKITPTIDDTT